VQGGGWRNLGYLGDYDGRGGFFVSGNPTSLNLNPPTLSFFFPKWEKSCEKPSIFRETYFLQKKTHRNFENCQSLQFSLKSLVFCSNLSIFVVGFEFFPSISYLSKKIPTNQPYFVLAVTLNKELFSLPKGKH